MENYIITREQAVKILNTLLDLKVESRYTIESVDILRALKKQEEVKTEEK